MQFYSHDRLHLLSKFSSTTKRIINSNSYQLWWASQKIVFSMWFWFPNISFNSFSCRSSLEHFRFFLKYFSGTVHWTLFIECRFIAVFRFVEFYFRSSSSSRSFSLRRHFSLNFVSSIFLLFILFSLIFFSSIGCFATICWFLSFRFARVHVFHIAYFIQLLQWGKGFFGIVLK